MLPLVSSTRPTVTGASSLVKSATGILRPLSKTVNRSRSRSDTKRPCLSVTTTGRTTSSVDPLLNVGWDGEISTGWMGGMGSIGERDRRGTAKRKNEMRFRKGRHHIAGDSTLNLPDVYPTPPVRRCRLVPSSHPAGPAPRAYPAFYLDVA